MHEPHRVGGASESSNASIRNSFCLCGIWFVSHKRWSCIEVLGQSTLAQQSSADAAQLELPELAYHFA